MTTTDGLLWHYTDLDALQGIAGGTFRASDTLYLNDTNEFKHYIELAIRYITEIGPPFPNIPGSIELPLIVEEMRRWSRPRGLHKDLYVTCFSTQRDDLSQWRGYASSPLGLALGFDRDLLEAAAKKERLWLARVEYADKKLRNDLQADIAKLYATAQKDPRFAAPWAVGTMNDQFLLHVIGEFTRQLAYKAAFTKSEAFIGEHEERIWGKRSNADVGLQKSRSLLVPYIEWKVPKAGERECPLKAIIVAPGPHKDEVATVLRMKYKHLVIETSKVPFRNW
jgi:hypothetical protein